MGREGPVFALLASPAEVPGNRTVDKPCITTVEYGAVLVPRGSSVDRERRSSNIRVSLDYILTISMVTSEKTSRDQETTTTRGEKNDVYYMNGIVIVCIIY